MSTARALAWRTGTAALRTALRLSGLRAGLVLVYHALAAQPGDPVREIVPPHSVDQFESQLRHLQACYRVVRAGELPRAVAARRRGARFPIAITFDDDLTSHVELAVPSLIRHGMPATFFLCGASLERPFSFWWERLQRAADAGLDLPVEGDGMHEVAGRIEDMSPDERAGVAEQLLSKLGGEPEDAGLRREQVQTIVAAGFDVGFHTLRHDRLPDLDDGPLEEALVDGRAELEDMVGRRLTAIAYPHGKADVRVAHAAAAAGFRVGFTGSHLPVVPSSGPLLLGRVEPTFGSTVRFAAQLVDALRRARHA